MRRKPIVGVFDSGIGGLTVLHECVKLVPYARYYYYGDNSNAPYGNKSPDEIWNHTKKSLDKFAALGADVVILACNTATACCIERARGEYFFPVIGAEPALKTADRLCRNALVLATKATCSSRRFADLLLQQKNCRFTVYPCLRLAKNIEDFLLNGRRFPLEEELPRGNFDGVVLGCTHYVFCKDEIARFYGAPTFDGNEGIARRLKSTLTEIGRDFVVEIGNYNHDLGWLTTHKCSSLTTPRNYEIDINFLNLSKNNNKMLYEQMFAT